MKNKFTINESERERILKLHEDEKPGLINRIKGAVQGFKNPTVATPQTTPTATVATPQTTPAATTSWATSADNTTICQTKPSKTMSPQVKQIQAAINKVFVPKPESKTIKGCSGNVLFPLKEDGFYGANTAKAIIIAINYKKLSGGQPPVQQGQPQQGQPQAGATDLAGSPEQAGSTVVNEF